MNKKALSERDICTKFITPAIERAQWDVMTQVREEVGLTKGRVIVRGKLVSRGKPKRADYVLFYKPNLPIAVIEAKDNNHAVGAGMQQALGYAEMLDVPFVLQLERRRLPRTRPHRHVAVVERQLDLDEFPSPDELWDRYRAWRGHRRRSRTRRHAGLLRRHGGKEPRYYQSTPSTARSRPSPGAEPRLLLVMATGTGKTYTAFQIIWRLWKAGVKKRILFLADRNILVDQTKTNDFKPVRRRDDEDHRTAPGRQVLRDLPRRSTRRSSGTEEEQHIYKQFSPDFFDLIVVDECHRGSAAEDSAWREVLDYFSSATQIGLTATPEGNEGRLEHRLLRRAHLHVLAQAGHRGRLPRPLQGRAHRPRQGPAGWRPEEGKLDKLGERDRGPHLQPEGLRPRRLVLEQRTELVAPKDHRSS